MKLVFIYNAKGGVVADVTGAIKKAVGKGECSLCNATYGVVSPKKEWKSFLKSLPERPTFFHKDDIPPAIQKYLKENEVDLPVVLRKQKKSYEIILKAHEMDSCVGSVKCLIAALKDKL